MPVRRRAPLSLDLANSFPLLVVNQSHWEQSAELRKRKSERKRHSHNKWHSAIVQILRRQKSARGRKGEEERASLLGVKVSRWNFVGRERERGELFSLKLQFKGRQQPSVQFGPSAIGAELAAFNFAEQRRAHVLLSAAKGARVNDVIRRWPSFKLIWQNSFRPLPKQLGSHFLSLSLSLSRPPQTNSGAQSNQLPPAARVWRRPADR